MTLVFVSPVFQASQRFSMFPEFLAITTLACLIDSVFASSLPVPLPLQPATCVTALDWINDDPHCPPLIGFVCLYLDCHTGYRTRSVKVVILHLCLRVEHLDRKLPRTLHRVKIDLPSPFSGEDNKKSFLCWARQFEVAVRALVKGD